MPTPAGWVFLLITCFLLPLAAIRGTRRLRRGTAMPTRAQYFASVVVSQSVPLVMALSAARYEYIRLFPRPRLDLASAVAAGALVLIAVGTLPARWGWKSADEKRRLLWITPNRPSDLWWWVLVALVAGVFEEIVYRGVMFTMWLRILGGWWPAAGVCVVVFALAHFVQGWRAVGTIALLSLGFHGIVWLSGDLYTAMAAHFVYDLLAGVIILRLARRDGVLRAAGPDGAAVAAAGAD